VRLRTAQSDIVFLLLFFPSFFLPLSIVRFPRLAHALAAVRARGAHLEEVGEDLVFSPPSSPFLPPFFSPDPPWEGVFSFGNGCPTYWN